MIASFGDEATADIFHGINSKAARGFPASIWDTARRKLDMINAAPRLEDLKVPPGNRLEALKGKYAGMHSIRVNDQFRIIFIFAEGGEVKKVQLIDYH